MGLREAAGKEGEEVGKERSKSVGAPEGNLRVMAPVTELVK